MPHKAARIPDTPDGVALALAERIHKAEKAVGGPAEGRDYWLELYAACLAVVKPAGTPPPNRARRVGSAAPPRAG